MNKNKKILIIIFSIIIIGISAILCLRFFSGEDSWICDNGEWIKHGNPISKKPTTNCQKSIDNVNVDKNIINNNDLILDNLKEGDLLKSGDIIKGKIKGGYFFEGTFPIIVKDLNENILGQTTTKITPNWETEDYVTFETEAIVFDKKDNNEGYLIFKNDNPSGLPENDKQISIKVKF